MIRARVRRHAVHDPMEGWWEGEMSQAMRVLLLTNEYPPHIYGGAGVHVEYLARELAKLTPVEVRTFGTEEVQQGHLRVRGLRRHVFLFRGPLASAMGRRKRLAVNGQQLFPVLAPRNPVEYLCCLLRINGALFHEMPLCVARSPDTQREWQHARAGMVTSNGPHP